MSIGWFDGAAGASGDMVSERWWMRAFRWRSSSEHRAARTGHRAPRRAVRRGASVPQDRRGSCRTSAGPSPPGLPSDVRRLPARSPNLPRRCSGASGRLRQVCTGCPSTRCTFHEFGALRLHRRCRGLGGGPRPPRSERAPLLHAQPGERLGADPARRDPRPVPAVLELLCGVAPGQAGLCELRVHDTYGAR